MLYDAPPGAKNGRYPGSPQMCVLPVYRAYIEPNEAPNRAVQSTQCADPALAGSTGNNATWTESGLEHRLRLLLKRPRFYQILV